MYTCRECEHPINQATEICPYCGADLTEAALPEAQAPTPMTRKRLVMIVLRWGVLLAAMWGFLWFVLPPRGDPVQRAESKALEAMSEVRAAVAAYAETQGGSYPSSLEALGERVRQAVQLAQSEGYRLEYRPGPAEEAGSRAQGPVHSYVLLARPSNYGYRSFYTDETGVVRATRENRAATPQDPPI